MVVTDWWFKEVSQPVGNKSYRLGESPKILVTHKTVRIEVTDSVREQRFRKFTTHLHISDTQICRYLSDRSLESSLCNCYILFFFFILQALETFFFTKALPNQIQYNEKGYDYSVSVAFSLSVNSTLTPIYNVGIERPSGLL